MREHPLLKYGVKSYFEREMLDNALTVGMTTDEFWFGDPELYYNYMRVYKEKSKLEQQNIWQIGARMCQALQSTVIFPAGVVDANAIRQMPDYPKCPYTEEQTEETMSEEEKELARKQFVVGLNNWVNSSRK